jgi:type II secretory pathway pseudopilin PulG
MEKPKRSRRSPEEVAAAKAAKQAARDARQAEKAAKEAAKRQREGRREKDRAERRVLKETLAAIINKVPARVNGGSIQETRRWMDDRRLAKRAIRRGSMATLRMAAATMQAWGGGPTAHPDPLATPSPATVSSPASP